MDFVSDFFDDLNSRFSRWWFKINTGDRIRLWDNLATHLINGMPLIGALELLRNIRIPRGKSDSDHHEAQAIKDWLRHIENGKTLADSVKSWTPPIESMLVFAGERSGRLPETLRALGDVLTCRGKIKGAIFSGLAYPAFLMLGVFGVLYLFGYKVVPAFTMSVKTGWTGQAANMIMVSSFVRNYLPFIAVMFACSIVLYFTLLNRLEGQIRIFLDRFPPFSIYATLEGSAWLISLAALISAGTRLKDAIEYQRDTASPWLRRRLEATLVYLADGKSLGDALDMTGYDFPSRELIANLRAYTSRSGLDQALEKLGRDTLNFSVTRIQLMMKVIFSMCLMFIGGVLVFMLTGMFAMQGQLPMLLQQSMR